jgi:hypothetical protein
MVMTTDDNKATAGDPLVELEQQILDEKLPEVCDFSGCERRFKSKQALATHRTRSHGLKTATKRKRRTTRRPRVSAHPRPRKKVEARAENGKATVTGDERPEAPYGRKPDLVEDQLLALVFPNGMPADADTIEMAHMWVEVARELRERAL